MKFKVQPDVITLYSKEGIIQKENTFNNIESSLELEAIQN